jgi:hypothetical protein
MYRAPPENERARPSEVTGRASSLRASIARQRYPPRSRRARSASEHTGKVRNIADREIQDAITRHCVNTLGINPMRNETHEHKGEFTEW